MRRDLIFQRFKYKGNDNTSLIIILYNPIQYLVEGGGLGAVCYRLNILI